MHLKVFMKLKKSLKTLSSGQKNPKKPKKPKKKQKKTQKNPLGWVFLKKPGFFPTLVASKKKIRIVDPDPDLFYHHGARLSGRSGPPTLLDKPKVPVAGKKFFINPHCGSGSSFLPKMRGSGFSDHSQTCFITTEPVCPDAPGPPTLLDKPNVAARKDF
jgi:hypothetical protein